MRKYCKHHNINKRISFTKNKPAIVLAAIFLLFTGNLVFPAMADNGTSTNSTSTSLHTTTTSIASNSTTVNIGAQVTLSVAVSDSSGSPTTPSGTISLSDGNVGGTFGTSCTLSSGSCTSTYTPSANSPGTVTITATYGGDSSHSTSSGTASLSITLLHGTATAITSNSTTVNTGAQVRLSVSVSDSSGHPTTPSGTASFADGNAGGTFNPASCTLSSGSCTSTYTPSANSPGTVTITATYGGDSSHSTSLGSTSLIVTSLDNTSTSITSNPTAIGSSGSAALTISVSDLSHTTATPTGGLSINDNNAGGTFNETSCTLSSGKCVTSYTPSTNAPHAVTITAIYQGDNTHLGSSGSLQLSTSALDSTTISITPNPASFTSGNPTTFTATITDPTNPSASIIGLVSWSDNGAGGLFNTDHCILVANHCSLVYTPAPNSHSVTITASYDGDTNHSGSSGTSTLTLAVQSAINTTTTSTTPNTNTTTPQPSPTQTIAPQATLPQTIATVTPQEETMIANAETTQTIAAEINLVNQTLQTKSIDNNVSVQTSNISSDSINISVSATNQTSSKVILLNLGKTTINVGNLGYLGVMYDGKPIAPAADVNSIFNANSTSNPQYAIIITQSGAQILILVPHFSTHTITITNISKVIPALPEFPFALPVFLISFASMFVFNRLKSRIT